MALITSDCGAKYVNGVQIGTIGTLGPSGCTVMFQEIELAQSPIARGQVLYLLVQTNVSLAQTGVSLVMDDGSGSRSRRRDCHSTAPPSSSEGASIGMERGVPTN